MNAQMVRTTVYLPYDLVVAAKLAAFENKTTLTGLMEEGLKEKLRMKKKKGFVLTPHSLGNRNYVFRRADAYE